MFGLSYREQRWKAEQEAAQLLVGLAMAAINARKEVAVAEAAAEEAPAAEETPAEEPKSEEA